MNNEIYISNLQDQISDNDLEKIFAQYGKVINARVIIDKKTGKSKKFGFVKMYNNEEAISAINSLNNTNLQGEIITVKEADKTLARESNVKFWH